MRNRPFLEFQDTQAIAAAVRAAARDSGAPLSIAVVDAGGALVRFERDDGARDFSVDLAIRKARTAALLSLSTATLAQRFAGGAPGGLDLLLLPGGAPVLVDGQCAGAVGVSGGPPELDEAVAAAGAAAVG